MSNYDNNDKRRGEEDDDDLVDKRPTSQASCHRGRSLDPAPSSAPSHPHPTAQEQNSTTPSPTKRRRKGHSISSPSEYLQESSLTVKRSASWESGGDGRASASTQGRISRANSNPPTCNSASPSRVSRKSSDRHDSNHSSPIKPTRSNQSSSLLRSVLETSRSHPSSSLYINLHRSKGSGSDEEDDDDEAKENAYPGLSNLEKFTHPPVTQNNSLVSLQDMQRSGILVSETRGSYQSFSSKGSSVTANSVCVLDSPRTRDEAFGRLLNSSGDGIRSPFDLGQRSSSSSTVKRMLSSYHDTPCGRPSSTAASSPTPSLPGSNGLGPGNRKRSASVQLSAEPRCKKALDGPTSQVALNPTAKKRPAPKFTTKDDEILCRGVALYGEKWSDILSWGGFDTSVRTAASLKSRWARLNSRKKSSAAAGEGDTLALNESLRGHLSHSNSSVFSMDEGLRKTGSGDASYSRHLADDEKSDVMLGVRSSPVRNTHSHDEPADQPQSSIGFSSRHSGIFGSSPVYPSKSSGSNRRIDEYFPRYSSSTKPIPSTTNSQNLPSSPIAGGIYSMSVGVSQVKFKSPVKKIERLKKMLREHEEEIVQLQQERTEILRQNEQLSMRMLNAESEVEHLERIHTTFKQEMGIKIRLMESRRVEREEKARTALLLTLRDQARQAGRSDRLSANDRSQSIAAIVYERHGVNFSERWQEGYKFADIQRQLAHLTRERDELEKRRKALAKKFKEDKKSDDPSSAQEYLESDEIAKLRLVALKKEEGELLTGLDTLNAERDSHIRECRRIRDEDASRFNNNPVLNDRYLLLKMIGKGGFSEVYKAFDLVEMIYVACKIHSLNDHWSDEKKQSYIKHSVREYNIHKSLDHPRIIRFLDVFEYDHFSFCTVLEYCEGQDLESYLQSVKSLPEREARSIIGQVVSALKYMNELETPIIHYDLKPGNILLDKGQVKITDFGLSKIVEGGGLMDSGHIGFGKTKETDLTSQGAGTYWYLPPEVFEARPGEAVKISSKVDVWSLGVIFFEVLYGTKPFGNNKSQYSILKESIITNDAQYLNFPAKPTVSQETKDFIRRCLEYRKDKRPDILALAKDSYFRPGHTKGSKSGAANSAPSVPVPSSTQIQGLGMYGNQIQQLMSDH